MTCIHYFTSFTGLWIFGIYDHKSFLGVTGENLKKVPHALNINHLHRMYPRVRICQTDELEKRHIQCKKQIVTNLDWEFPGLLLCCTADTIAWRLALCRPSTRDCSILAEGEVVRRWESGEWPKWWFPWRDPSDHPAIRGKRRRRMR